MLLTLGIQEEEETIQAKRMKFSFENKCCIPVRLCLLIQPFIR